MRRRMKNEGLRVKDYYWVSLIDTTMEAKQYVDGGETIRRWRRNNTSMKRVPYMGQAGGSGTFGHWFGQSAFPLDQLKNLWAD